MLELSNLTDSWLYCMQVLCALHYITYIEEFWISVIRNQYKHLFVALTIWILEIFTQFPICIYTEIW